jgi:bacillithiol synthase
MESIPFEDIPSSFNSISTLYSTYLTQYDRLGKFYNAPYKNLSGQRHILEGARSRRIDRSQLAAILEDQQIRMATGKDAEAHALLLEHDNTFAIVTGQQVGLFGGPLYTILKIVTVLKLADKLRERIPDCNFVPVFYLEAEDHDFDEMSGISIINAGNDLQTFRYFPGGKPLEKNLGPVGSIVFDEEINSVLDALGSSLQPTDFRAAVMEMLRDAYRPGGDFTAAFVHLIKNLFANSGLVFLDPRDRAIKQLIRPILLRELTSHPKTSEIVIKRSAALEEIYHAQAKPRAVNLFLLHRGGRFLIEPRETGFGLKGARQRFTDEEMKKLIEDSPELFSPNVLLRPIVQDYLLPTFVYVAGPSEIAYFAQLKEVYEHFEVTMPVIYPRASGTIIEEKVMRITEKFDITPYDLFSNIELLQKNISGKLSDVKLDDVFDKTLKQMDADLKELRYALNTVDPTLKGAYENAYNKIEFQVNKLKQKAFEAQRKKFSTAMRQLEKAALHAAPNGTFQERVFPFFQYSNKYGFGFVDWLYEQVDIEKFEHQLFYR